MTTVNVGITRWKDRLNGFFNRLLEQRWFNLGLRAKMGLLVEIGLIGLIAIFLVLGVSNARQTTQKILNERIVLARLSAAMLDSAIRQVETALILLGQHEVMRNPQVDRTEHGITLQDAFDQLSNTSQALLYFDTSGVLVAERVRPNVEINHSRFEDLRKILLAYQRDETRRLVTLPGDGHISAIIVQVRDAGDQPSGYLVALLDLEGSEFSPLRKAIDLGQTGTIDVVDRSGQVLLSSHPDRAQVGDSLIQVRDKLFLEGEANVETCLGCGGVDPSESAEEVIAFAPLLQAPWGVVVRQKSSELMAPVNRLLVQTLLLGAVTIIGALFLVWATTSSVIKPVQMLKVAAERIATGDLDTPIELPTQVGLYGRTRRTDEIGDLAESFAGMRRKLKQSMNEIYALNQVLDQRVRERTQAAIQAQLNAQATRDDLRAIIDALSDELIVVNIRDYSVELANRVAMVSNQSPEQLIGKKCKEICHRGEPCTRPDCDCPVPSVVAQGNSVRVTHELAYPDGRTVYKEIIASPMYDTNGQINRVVELRRDITEQIELQNSLIRRNQQLSIVNAVAMTVNQSLQLEDILSRSLEALLRMTEIDVGAVFLHQEVTGELRLMAHQGLSEEAAHYASEIGMVDGSCGGVMEHGQIVIVPEIGRFRSKRARRLQRENLSSLVHVPLIAKGSVLGSMCVGTRCQRDFGADEQELLRAIGNQIAVAIENARLYAEVQAKERMRGELFMKSINAQEEERKRIARELHDDTSQALAALLFAMEESLEMQALPAIHARLQGMHELIQHILEGVHKMIFDLRPSLLDHLGLAPAIRWFAESRLEKKGVRVKLEDASQNHRLPPEVETALFRISQEAIVNIARHAAARNVEIKITNGSDSACLEIQDDGVGFDITDLNPETDSMRGLGLLGIQERLELLGGNLEIHSLPGSGTRLSIRVPLQRTLVSNV